MLSLRFVYANKVAPLFPKKSLGKYGHDSGKSCIFLPWYNGIARREIMRIAIIDDSSFDRETLESCLAQYVKEESKEYHYGVDFIILDIDMPGINGIEAAKKLREKDPHVTLMFMTNMPQYAIESYSVAAMDYVLKPVKHPDFKLKMKKAEQYVARNSDSQYFIHAREGTIQCMASDILFIESQRHYLYCLTKSGIYKEHGKFSDMAEKLSGQEIIIGTSQLSKRKMVILLLF